jgi:16S rRNA (cytosine967-C5)-methyltransferase
MSSYDDRRPPRDRDSRDSRSSRDGNYRDEQPERKPSLTARRVALDALERVDDGAYANIVLSELLDNSRLDVRDKAFATELFYGTVRRRRSVDWLVMQHVERDPEDSVLRVLHLGAYQLAFLGVPPHAAVGETVDVCPPFARGFVNAVLRNVARAVEAGFDWPDQAIELSYPDWIVERLQADLGDDTADATLRFMNEAPHVTEREDGYVQDLASQWVVELLDPQPGERIIDLCAAPGGKATLIGSLGAEVIAADVRPHRIGLIADNVDSLGLTDLVLPVASDGLAPPYAYGSFDRVLLDVPCSGLGVLHRRADARWRMTEEDIAELVVLQRRLLQQAIRLVKPGGILMLSACTLTNAESVAHDFWLSEEYPNLVPDLGPGADKWERHGRGLRVLPQTHGTDGMVAFRYRVS